MSEKGCWLKYLWVLVMTDALSRLTDELLQADMAVQV